MSRRELTASNKTRGLDPRAMFWHLFFYIISIYLYFLYIFIAIFNSTYINLFLLKVFHKTKVVITQIDKIRGPTLPRPNFQVLTSLSLLKKSAIYLCLFSMCVKIDKSEDGKYVSIIRFERCYWGFHEERTWNNTILSWQNMPK